MEPVDYLGIPIDVCPECAGVWFDDGELAKLARTAPQALEILDSQFLPNLEVLNVPGNQKLCPRCGVRLSSYNYVYDSPVVIDSCEECRGVFVEDQELEAIYSMMEQGDRTTVSALITARRRLKDPKSTGMGIKATDRTVAALLHALRHWKERRGTPTEP